MITSLARGFRFIESHLELHRVSSGDALEFALIIEGAEG